ncbi:MAG: hypothetical protein PHD76_08260 [Methylacidiphilales bacterium]|nr:hypothetical protein [Candidatus Methylacidiphilales bacterium]
MKKLIIFLLIAEFLTSFTVLAPTCILRHDMIHAISVYANKPTLENKTEVDRQRQITQRYSIGISSVIFSIMAGSTLFLFRIRKNSKSIIEKT